MQHRATSADPAPAARGWAPWRAALGLAWCYSALGALLATLALDDSNSDSGDSNSDSGDSGNSADSASDNSDSNSDGSSNSGQAHATTGTEAGQPTGAAPLGRRGRRRPAGTDAGQPDPADVPPPVGDA